MEANTLLETAENIQLFSKFQLSFSDYEICRSSIDQILAAVISDKEFREDPRQYVEFIREIVNYNVIRRKLMRGVMGYASFKHFVPNPTKEEMFSACVLGWVPEIFMGYATILDDIVDRSETRHGKLSWYKISGCGDMAPLDSNILLAISFWILNHYFGNMPCYNQIMQIYIDVFWRCIHDETLDARTTEYLSVENYTHQLHKNLVQGKISVLTFYLPVALAAVLAGKFTDDINHILRDIAVDIGYIHSVEDEYMEIFGDPRITLAGGTDIQEGKCTWIIVEALNQANAEEKKILIENYGKDDPSKVLAVKDCLKNMGMPERFRKYQESNVSELQKKLESLRLEDVPVTVYESMIACVLNTER